MEYLPLVNDKRLWLPDSTADLAGGWISRRPSGKPVRQRTDAAVLEWDPAGTAIF